MIKYLVQQLRACARVKGKQKPAVDALTDEQLLEVFHRLRKGQNANEVGRYAQRAWNFMPGRSPHTVGQAIRKFEKRISHLILKPLQAEKLPLSETGLLSDSVTPKGIEGHHRLYYELLDRTLRLIREERETGIPYKDVAKDAIAVSSVRKTLLKMEEFELTKIDPRKIYKIQKEKDELQRRLGLEGSLNTGTEEERQRMFLNRWLDIIDENAEGGLKSFWKIASRRDPSDLR
jgi:DNA-binding transcriptional MerR regulator